jgi:hypothetical protein
LKDLGVQKMSENMNDDLKKFEDMDALLSSEEKSANVDEKGAPSVFMTDIRFKESVDAGELLDEAAFSVLDEEDQKGYEMINVMNEETKEPMGWMFRFKAEDDSEEEDAEADVSGDAEVEETADEVSGEEDAEEKSVDNSVVSEKAAKIMSMMNPATVDKPSMFLTDTRFKEMMEEGELISSEDYDGLDEDAKSAFEEVAVYEEGTGKGYGMSYRRRSPMEVVAMRKMADNGEKAEDGESNVDMFDTEAEAIERAAVLGCEGVHRAGVKFMPCATHEEWLDLAKSDVDETPDAAPAPAAPTAPAAPAAAGGMKSEEDFLCGFQRKSVNQPCEFCHGGCSPEDGLPGLGDIESQVKSAYEGSEVVGSGYSVADDMFVVDVKRADGSCIEVFLSGDGQELGWLKIDENALEGKSLEQINIISKSDAEQAAVTAFAYMDVEAKGEVMGVMVDVFADEDVYVVEVEASEKSYDFFISVEGKVLGYDEYDLIDEVKYEMTEEDEIKALEAELQIKRMYSREQRESMSESGEAMPDGSFPIADEADLQNAIQAHGRASDVEAAKAHITKRAKELGLEDMIPEDWSMDSGQESGDEEKSLDADIVNALQEFQSLMEEGLS